MEPPYSGGALRSGGGPSGVLDVLLGLVLSLLSILLGLLLRLLGVLEGLVGRLLGLLLGLLGLLRGLLRDRFDLVVGVLDRLVDLVLVVVSAAGPRGPGRGDPEDRDAAQCAPPEGTPRRSVLGHARSLPSVVGAAHPVLPAAPPSARPGHSIPATAS